MTLRTSAKCCPETYGRNINEGLGGIVVGGV
jgi:hypothetical protein